MGFLWTKEDMALTPTKQIGTSNCGSILGERLDFADRKDCSIYRVHCQKCGECFSIIQHKVEPPELPNVQGLPEAVIRRARRSLSSKRIEICLCMGDSGELMTRCDGRITS